MRKHQQPANKQKQEGDAAIQIISNRIPDREITYACQRVYERGYYLLTLNIGFDFTGSSMEYAPPQAHAVMDDFGTLRITRGFR